MKGATTKKESNIGKTYSRDTGRANNVNILPTLPSTLWCQCHIHSNAPTALNLHKRQHAFTTCPFTVLMTTQFFKAG